MSREQRPHTSDRNLCNLCPVCNELWLAGWMKRLEVTTCPICDGPLVAYIPPAKAISDANEVRNGRLP